ncbi:MAG: carboxymuconolactone decarboxylase family protein [Longimicrobiales bacterium]|nr:carboxymuconolactone decarboxylase family protein [Longimicrobiales bacterium]
MKRPIATALALALLVPAAALAQDSLAVVPSAAPARLAPAENFTGTVRVSGWFEAEAPARSYGATVAFEPGARTHWHTHALGQTLVITAGTGRVQQWGGPVREVRPGDVVRIPAGAKHWHGAAPDAPMTHVALVERPDDGPATEWMEAVSGEQYAAGAPAARPGEDRPSRAQQLMGDIAPELADLTDGVLYGRVWADPTLSARDRSLVTVSALIALNRPDQLRSHLGLALRNGVTEDELIGAITHLAFYSGWPNAVTAVGVAREVFEQR